MTELICFLFGIVIGLVCNMMAEEIVICKCTGKCMNKCKGDCNQGRNCTCTSES